MNFKAPIAFARGLGAAKEGVHHWWWQRLTAIALVPLTFWFAALLVRLPEAGYEELLETLASPWGVVFLVSFVVAGFCHALLGLEVVIEDYVHSRWIKLGSLIGVKLILIFLALVSLVATLRLLLTD